MVNRYNRWSACMLWKDVSPSPLRCHNTITEEGKYDASSSFMQLFSYSCMEMIVMIMKKSFSAQQTAIRQLCNNPDRPSHWMRHLAIRIHLIYKPALGCFLLSLHPLAEPLVSSLHFSSSLVPHSRLCFLVGWASPPHSPSVGCCSWTLLFLHQGRCPVAIGCQSSQCPGRTYSNHWKMALCREKLP